jgi:hypothetical protein
MILQKAKVNGFENLDPDTCTPSFIHNRVVQLISDPESEKGAQEVALTDLFPHQPKVSHNISDSKSYLFSSSSL